MNAMLILDRDSKTDLSERLLVDVLSAVERKGYSVEVVELGKENAFPCRGCLRCLTVHPGRCVSRDRVGEIIPNVDNYDLTIFLTPVLFGHFSSTIANAMHRGTGSHDWQLVIGYGDDVDEEEKRIFIDLTAKHRGRADVVHPGMDRQVDVYVSRSAEESAAICAALTSSV